MKKRNQKLMSLILAMVMMLICFVACGNANSDSNTTTQSTTTSVPEPTGYPSGTVQKPMLYLNGKLYEADYNYFNENVTYENFTKEHPLTAIGETKAEKNDDPPTEEFIAARIPVGTKIYSDENGKIFTVRSNNIILAMKLSNEEENKDAQIPDGTPLTSDEVLWFDSEYFNGETVNIRNNFLSCNYTKPEEIDFSQLFYNGIPDGQSTTEAELDELKKESGFVPELDTIKITAEKMDSIFEEYTGLKLDKTDKRGLDSFFYLEKYNSYYLNHGDTNYQLVFITEGYRNTNGNIILNYETLNSSIKAFGQVTLKDAGNNKYYFVSNIIQ